MKIILGSDHGGFELKAEVKKILETKGHQLTDVGVNSSASVDYPDMAVRACLRYQNEKFDRGILFCGTGIGISISANKIPGIRCAQVHDSFTARMAIEHNQAHFIALGGRITYKEPLDKILEAWLTAVPDTAQRHQRRVDKIMTVASKYTETLR